MFRVLGRVVGIASRLEQRWRHGCSWPYPGLTRLRDIGGRPTSRPEAGLKDRPGLIAGHHVEPCISWSMVPTYTRKMWLSYVATSEMRAAYASRWCSRSGASTGPRCVARACCAVGDVSGCGG